MLKFSNLFKKKENNSFEFYPDDVFLVSFPKSGNTWLRFMIGNYITNCTLDFTNSHLFLPDIHLNPESCKDISIRPRFIKSHMPYRHDYPKVVYIIRDGRDVAVSYYFYLQRRKQIEIDTPFNLFLSQYIKNGAGNFGDWSSHIESWTNVYRSHVIVIKYEDMLSNPSDQLKKILTFSGIEYETDKIEKAVMASQFNEMQRLEAKNSDFIFTTFGVSNDVKFVRKGCSGDWKNYFSDEDEKLFMNKHGDMLNNLGYN